MNPATGQITQRDSRVWMQGANGEWIIRPVLWNNLRMLFESHVPLLGPSEDEIFQVARGYGADVPTVILCRRQENSTNVRKLPEDTAARVNAVFEKCNNYNECCRLSIQRDPAQPPRQQLWMGFKVAWLLHRSMVA